MRMCVIGFGGEHRRGLLTERREHGCSMICKQKRCRASSRCAHPWWFDVMHEGRRWRMRVDDFALARGATEAVTLKQSAEGVREPKFLGEIMSG